jgi:hypothetical protein
VRWWWWWWWVVVLVVVLVKSQWKGDVKRGSAWAEKGDDSVIVCVIMCDV